MSEGNRTLARVSDLRVDRVEGRRDSRGTLYPVELSRSVTFTPVRLFWILDVPVGTIRGEHGHKLCSQYLICCAGKIDVTAFDGISEAAFGLGAGHALHIPPGIYAQQRFQKADTMLLVLC